MIRRGKVAGVILFSDNLPSRSAGRRLIARLQHVPRPRGLRDPLLVMIDQEGGLVKRIGGAPTASAAVMGARGPGFSRRQGRRTARNLRNLGASVNLAPVLDVARPGSDIAVTERGFGSSARRVRATAIPFAKACRRRRRGDREALPRPRSGEAEHRLRGAADPPLEAPLRHIDELPYRRFVASRGAMVMLSTAIYPAYSPKPAAFARPLATRELRVRLGFRGVSISDALETASVGAFGGPAKAGLAAAKAGTDLLLFTSYHAGARAYGGLRRKLRSGDLDRQRFERSVQRVLVLRHRAGRDLDDAARRRGARATGVLGGGGHRGVAADVEYVYAVAAIVLGRVHRQVSLGDHRVHVEPRVSVERATPMHAVTAATSPASVPSRIALVRDSATRRASRSPVSGRRIANSSPPSRASESDSRRRSPRTSGDLLQHLVAGEVAEGVVDRLEVVDVDQQQRPGRHLAARARHLGLDLLLETAPVPQPGQRVLLGESLQLLVEALAVADVADCGLQFGDLPVHRIGDRACRGLDPE